MVGPNKKTRDQASVWDFGFGFYEKEVKI